MAIRLTSVLILPFLFQLCAEAQPVALQSDPSFRLGVVAPFSGPAASFGVMTKQGVDLAVDEWNAKGGVLGKKIQIFLEDDRNDPSYGIIATKSLINNDHVTVIIGAIASRVSLACAPICQAAKVPMISPTSTNPSVTTVGDYIFRSCIVDPFLGEIGANFAYQNRKARKAACYFDAGNTYTQGLAQAFQTQFKSLGGEVLTSIGHATWASRKGYENQPPPVSETDPNLSEFDTQIQHLLIGNPDVLYAPDYYEGAIRVIKKARELGYTGLIVGGDTWDCPDLHRMPDPVFEGCYFTNHFAPDSNDPIFTNFVAKLKWKSGFISDPISACAYDATNLMLNAVNRAGTTQGSDIRDALQHTKTECLTGSIKFDENRNPIRPGVIIGIKNKALTYITNVNF